MIWKEFSNAKDRNIKNNEITKELNISIIGQSENKINEISEAENGNEKKSLNWKKNNKKLVKLKKLSDLSHNKINNLSDFLVNSIRRVEEVKLILP